MSTPPDEQPRLGYRPALDGVRAVAIALVFVLHTSYHLIPSWNGEVMPAGFLGVDVFLALSGFLITTLLLERHHREPHPIRRFWARRALRLMPAALVLLAVNLACAVVFGKDVADALRSFAVVLGQWTNWAEINGVGISAAIVHFWSLAIEGQFYLVWPLLLFGALKLGLSRRQLIALVLLATVGVVLWRAHLWNSGRGWLQIYLRTDARADSLLIGVTLALLPYDRLVAALGPRVRAIVGVAALAGIIVVAQVVQPSSEILYMGGFTVVAVMSTVLVAMALQPSPLYGLLANAPVVFLGRISYSLYLWHLPVFDVVAHHTEDWSALPRTAVGWSIALGAATCSYLFVERPALRLKSRLGRAGASGSQTPGPGSSPAPLPRAPAPAGGEPHRAAGP
jgi:peptidoglycan/LPS O-acetylase OafA/YrhL